MESSKIRRYSLYKRYWYLLLSVFCAAGLVFSIEWLTVSQSADQFKSFLRYIRVFMFGFFTVEYFRKYLRESRRKQP